MKIIGLDTFDAAFKDFEKNAWAIHYDYHFKDPKRLNDFNLQIRAQVLAEDIGIACMTFRDFYMQSIDGILKRTGRLPHTIPMPQLKAANILKYLFFLIRAYQDAIYRILLRIFEQQASHYSSIKSIFDKKGSSFKQGNLAGGFIKTDFSEYSQWFFKFREWRNEIKNGQGVNFTTTQHFVDRQIEIKIGMENRITNAKTAIGLEEVAESLTISQKLTELTIGLGRSKNLF